jgi:peptide/nickel transport system permease protein
MTEVPSFKSAPELPIEPQGKLMAEPAVPVPFRNEGEKVFVATQWQLMWWKFRAHRVGFISLIILGIITFAALFAPFLTPADPWRTSGLVYAPPMAIHVFHDGQLQAPFVYGIKQVVDPILFSRTYAEDTDVINTIQFFVRGDPYNLLFLFPTDIHLFGLEGDAPIHLLGTDSLGRDFLSRAIAASQISLSIGIVGVIITFAMACAIGGVAGYYGGVVDNLLQRFMEFVTSIPTLPMIMALGAAIPLTWPQLQTYFVITVILALRSWTGLSRVVRSKLIQLREEDYILAAKVAGTRDSRIIFSHLLPGFTSVLIVHLTLAIPGMILWETALSFVGLGLRPPTISWGVLLQDAQNVGSIAARPWLLFPALHLIVAVVAFNFVGDALRDAADPYND